jgi:hypothetical protein
VDSTSEVFISYGYADAAWVGTLAENLERAGVRTCSHGLTPAAQAGVPCNFWWLELDDYCLPKLRGRSNAQA